MQETKLSNPLLDKLTTPGETFRLPSQGLFYTNGELTEDVMRGEVVVYPMTTLDEIVLNTPDMLLSGSAVTTVISRRVPQILRPELLLSTDVDFLMLCLRMVTFGRTLSMTFQHTCQGAENHEYDVDLSTLIARAKEIDPTSLDAKFKVVMPNGQVVLLRPLIYKQILALYQMAAKSGDTSSWSLSETETFVVDALSGVIRSVDGITDPSQIRVWLEQIPLGWKRDIETAAQQTSSWGAELELKTKCVDCGADISIPISVNPVSFFS